MPMLEKYRHYFKIDPDYFPAVNEKVIEKNPDMWKKFYPHETFVRLIRNTVSVLERKDKLSIWVEGAYGTGKSHAVLTIKKLLDASAEETEAYFQKYHLNLDLYKRFQSVKSSGSILTIHRSGSSSIRSDQSLVFAVQESIEHALKEKGIENKSRGALRSATINWLSDSYNRNFFNDLITGPYSDCFGGDDVDAVINNLNTYTGDSLSKLMDNIFRVAEEHHITPLSPSVTDLCNWIREIIKANNLKAIVFIWDEFTEYFKNNQRRLTGFQELCEVSETDPFYLMIVTHVSSGMFLEKDQDFIKLNGRFISPHCIISLPENIAFQLMGAALEKNPDEAVLEDWDLTLSDLIDRTRGSRKIVQDAAHITDKEMQDILPIHPYTALLLKYISSAFASNQRSMFSFIKGESLNDDDEDEKRGFQWFIDKYGPDDDNPLLTIDMLWEYFYDRGKEDLDRDVRSVLDYYNRALKRQLDSDEKRVLKTVLLLQAISDNSGDSVELFIPNEKNIEKAFEGSDIEKSAVNVCNKLVRDKVLLKKSLGSGKFEYGIYKDEGEVDTAPFEELIDKKSTTSFITEELADKTHVFDAVSLSGALKLRYVLRHVSSNDLETTAKQLRNSEEKYDGHIVALVCYSKNEDESVFIGKKIQDLLNDGSYHLVFIDTSHTPLGELEYRQYKHDLALSMAWTGKDKDQSSQYAKNAREILTNWKNKILSGEFTVYSDKNPQGERSATIEELYTTLKEINRSRFPDCLEGAYNVVGNMYTMRDLKLGVACGANQKTSQSYSSSSSNTKLENALSGAWKIDNYWTVSPHLLISKIKIAVDALINADFTNGSGSVSIRKIYDFLKAAPYGFMPCNLSAFIIGFILKEYLNGNYSWGDGLTNEPLTLERLKSMVNDVIRLDVIPNPRYKDQYIVAMTPEQKSFNEITSSAFGIALNLCTSIANVRERIRSKMKELPFPLWTLNYILDTEQLATDRQVISNLIEDYLGVANSNNAGSGESDTSMAMKIGSIALKNSSAVKDLSTLITDGKCTAGMVAYLNTFEDGALPKFAGEVGDEGRYINVLREKFSKEAEDAKWVWNKETAEQKIRDVMLEYRIIIESNKILNPNVTFDETIQGWLSKCGYIRISFDAAKGCLKEAEPLLEMLCKITKAGRILESQKEEFYDKLKAGLDAFQNFYANQIEVFKVIVNLNGLSDEDIKEIFNDVPSGVFTYDKAKYVNLVEAKIVAHRENQKSAKLKKFWKDKTGSDTPKSWSKEHRMPILCLISDDDLEKAKAAFETVNSNSANTSDIDKANEFFESAKFFERLSDQNELDKAFREGVIKNYSVMLPDIDEVKSYLESNVSAEAYSWYGLPEVEKKIRQLAQAKYSSDGYKIALDRIKEMNEKEIWTYLKGLIQDNIDVGMEIIKSMRNS